MLQDDRDACAAGQLFPLSLASAPSVWLRGAAVSPRYRPAQCHLPNAIRQCRDGVWTDTSPAKGKQGYLNSPFSRFPPHENFETAEAADLRNPSASVSPAHLAGT
ncbi:hypothetical protein AAFF_G00113230 [Aldrovandia affinis]|uniref:Uncharacterized protein n=1 Tax=Aldrovandia affinis TaxID=143900 RepID=A0AAD7RT20_9TELE|nr:hypothetical protein AAFF_G00113230 [Aldrovandia affinis]